MQIPIYQSSDIGSVLPKIYKTTSIGTCFFDTKPSRIPNKKTMAEDPTHPKLRYREQDLAGKVAIVTGASRGIGRAIALNLASRGCSILGTCSSATNLHLIDNLSHSINELYRVNVRASEAPKIVGTVGDILRTTTPTVLAVMLQREFGGHCDIFVNNACQASAVKIGELTDEHVQDYLMANVRFPVKMVEELVRRKFFRPGGRIVMISSVRARKGWADQYASTNFMYEY